MENKTTPSEQFQNAIAKFKKRMQIDTHDTTHSSDFSEER
jgi:hypothetical protein